MDILTTHNALRNWKEDLDGSLAFVPTMGALHAGHLSLIEQGMDKADHSLVSVFVNPTQFNDPKDLEAYPRTLEKDVNMALEAGAKAVFAPSVEEMYPKDYSPYVMELGGLGEVMEGSRRPGHFEGVIEVVHRLFTMVRPDIACFGEKDFQQLMVIRRLAEVMDSGIEIHPCPILREAHGLAMSSRNERLSDDDRNYAGIIYRTLKSMREMSEWMNPDEVAAWGRKELEAEKRIDLEYLEVVGEEDLQVLFRWKEQPARAFVAAHIGGIRLIDNMSMNR